MVDDSLQAKKILVVEDDDNLRKLLSDILMKMGANVRACENGLIAKGILTSTQFDFDLIVSDIKMPELDGLGLLKFSKAEAPQVKFVLTTGFSEVLESRKAADLGADGFLAKPFKKADLTKSISDIFNPPSEKKPEGIEDQGNYCRIHITEFTASSKLPSDVYVKVTGDKYIKVAHEATLIPPDHLRIYQEKKIDYFYVKAYDFAKYLGMTLKVPKGPQQTAMTKEKKMHIFQRISITIAECSRFESLKREAFGDAITLVNNTLQVVASYKDSANLLEILDDHSEYLFPHGVAAAMFSAMIARQMDINDQAVLFKLSLAGLFHDIGKREIPNEILEKQRHLLKREEIVLLESVPTRSRDILNQIGVVPADVVQIAYQHHENQTGSGYPNRLNAKTLHPLAKILIVANEFCKRVQRGPQNEIKKTPHQAIQEIITAKRSEVDLASLLGLMRLFDFPIPDEMKRKI